jgi:hypothetical protein
MKHTLFIICLNVVIIASGLPMASAKDAPTSAEQLRSEVESALKSKDTNAFKALFNWQGVSESMKADMNDENADIFSHDVASVKLAALPTDFQPTNELNGVRYKPNVAVVGMIDVEYTEKGNAVSMPYGKTGDVFYLSSTVEERIATPTTKEKSLNVSVMGSAMPDAGGFTGSYAYVKGGKEITADINGKGNRSEAFWGDYIKSCTVRKTADNQDWIKLVISEDGKKIFESEETTNKEPIVYEKK